MEDHLLAKAWPDVLRHMVRLVLTQGNHDFDCGTGFIVGKTAQTNRLLIVTVRHVLPTDEVRERNDKDLAIRIERYSEQGEQIGSRSVPVGRDIPRAKLPCMWHLLPEVDLGLLLVPVGADLGDPFVYNSDSAAVRIAVTTDAVVPAPGTTVAWAGFPVLMLHKDVLGFTLPCYFEGVVSGLVMRDRLHRIFVDQHVLPGVSGGPLWFWREDKQQVTLGGLVMAIASHVNQNDGSRIPGFGIVHPVWPTIQFISKFGR